MTNKLKRHKRLKAESTRKKNILAHLSKVSKQSREEPANKLKLQGLKSIEIKEKIGRKPMLAISQGLKIYIE